MKKMVPGRGWAYFGLLLGLAGSTTGNVANTVLTQTDVPLALRVPFAVAWPVWTWVGIEVLTRTQWRRSWPHWIARLILMGPTTLVAAFVSYLHLHHVMLLAGEPGLAQAVGPLAVDGTLFGCTVALLVTRRKMNELDDQATKLTLAERVAAMRATALAVKDAALTGETQQADPAPAEVPAEDIVDAELVPVTNVPAVPVLPALPTQRGPVALRGSWDVAKAVQMILAGERDEAVATAVGVGAKMVQRTRRAVLVLKADPTAEIPAAWKVPAAAVQIIRQELVAQAVTQ